MSRVVEGHPIPFRAKLIALGALGLAGPVMIACGAESGDSGNGVSNDPDANPNATRTLSPPEQPDLLTPTLEPELTATEEVETHMSPQEILEYGNRVLANYPETPQFDIRNIRQALEYAVTNYEIIESGSNPNFSPTTVLNSYGNASLGLKKVACDNPQDEQIGLLWLETRKFVESYATEKLGSDVANDFLNTFYTVLPDCTHPVLTAANSN